jgi:exosortase/archaeosortase family protein
MIKELSTYFDKSFFIRFILLFVPLYYFHIGFLAITDPNNYYSAFIDNNFNYLKWVTNSINSTASLITHFFGINSGVEGKLIFVQGGARVLLEFACLGVGITSFWVAFIVAHNAPWKSTLYWCLGGIIAIWFLNCWRIAILVIAIQNKWEGNRFFDHHDVFNLVSYIIISLFIYMYYKRNKEEETQVPALDLP